MMFVTGLIIFLLVVLLISLKVVYQYEIGVKFTLGNYSGMMNPGLRIVVPVIQTWERVDMRLDAVNVPDQDCITKDNVSVRVNAVLYYRVKTAEKSIIQVESYSYAVSQLAQTTMRNVVGAVSLDELLGNREEVSKKIKIMVDKATEPWGIDIEAVDLKDISLPENLKRTMAKGAESERERRAMIITAEGEKIASVNLMKAAHVLGSSKGALHLRTLQNFNDISSDPSNTIVFAVPVETLNALEGFEKRGD